jgi:hypothetical protein
MTQIKILLYERNFYSCHIFIVCFSNSNMLPASSSQLLLLSISSFSVILSLPASNNTILQFSLFSCKKFTHNLKT